MREPPGGWLVVTTFYVHGSGAAEADDQLLETTPDRDPAGLIIMFGDEKGDERGDADRWLLWSHATTTPHRPRGPVYHVLNRAVARLALFEKDADYEAFERVLAEAIDKHPTRLLSYVVMPNHWHMVIWPREDGELTRFVRWLTHTHVMR